MVKLVEIIYLVFSKIAVWFGNFFDYFNKQSSTYPNITKSLILHAIIFLFVAGAVPSCARKFEEPQVISVQISPLSSKDKQAAAPGKIQPNKEVKPEPPTPEAKPEEKPLDKPEEIVKKPPVKQVLDKPNLTEKKPVEKPQEKPVDKPTPDKSKDAKKKPKDEKKLKQKEEESVAAFKDSLLKNLEESEDGDPSEKPNNKKATPTKSSNSGQEGFVPDAAFINEIMSKIQGQVTKCWSIPIGAQNINTVKVPILIKFNQSGGVITTEITETARYNSDLTYRAVADSGVRAIKECSPIQGLPADKYEFWKDVEFIFSPKDAL